jgi:hypothetical protein
MAKKKLSKDDGNRILYTQGWFHGLNYIMREYGLDAGEVAKMKSHMFQLLLAKVIEGKKEVARLHAVIERLEAACKDGSVPKPYEGLDAYGSAAGRVRDAAKALDGWTISLLETDMSILGAVETPETAGLRIKGLQKSFAELWALRIEGWHAMKNFPEVFDVETIAIH